MDAQAKLAGKRLLVIEDEYLIADDLCRLITENGGVAVGPYASSAVAMKAIAKEAFDFAILDIALAGNAVYPLAEELRRRRTPFVFLTGFSNRDVRPDFAATPMLEKPAEPDRVLALIVSVLKSG